MPYVMNLTASHNTNGHYGNRRETDYQIPDGVTMSQERVQESFEAC
jgi:hypothetical protein